MIKNIPLNKYAKIVIVSIFLILVAVQAHKSFVLDEIDFPIVSHATALTGKPVYYRGETSPTLVGTYHPTLYINTLAAFLKVFGFNETSVRVFGLICALISVYLLILIMRRLIKKNRTAETLLLGLFLLNPYTIANVTLPDIDSTVLPVVLLLFLYVALRFLLQRKSDTSNRAMWILAALFGLALWSKLTTPLVIPPFLACLAIITTKDYKRSLLFTLKVTAIGFVGFVVTYFLYCKLLGLSTTYTYHFLVASFTKGTNTDGPIVGAINNLKNIRTFIYWPTVPVVVLLGVSFFGVMLDKDKSKETWIKKLIVLTGLLVTLFYIALIAPFGGFFKYPFPVFGLSILTILFFYDRYLKVIKIKPLYALLAALFGFFIEWIFWKDSMFKNSTLFHGLILLLLAMIAIYVLLQVKNTRQIASVSFVLLIFFAIGFQLSISRTQAIQPYPTKYHYGQSGLDETTAYLRSKTNHDEIIWGMKDVGYYTNNKYYESYAAYFDTAQQANLIKMLKGSKVRYYVVSTGIGEDNIDYYPNIKKILDTYAVREKQFGNFIIYKSKE